MTRDDDLHEAYEQQYDEEHHAETLGAPHTSAG